MSKKLTLMIVVLALCLVFAQSAFAEEKTYPDEYRMF